MLGRSLKKQEIDAIAKKLVENDVLPLSEIERIIAEPGLFDLVHQRIQAAEMPAAQVSGARGLRWLPAAAVSLACLVVLAVLASTILINPVEVNDVPSMTYIQVLAAAPDIARHEIPPQEVFGKLSPGRTLQNIAKAEKVSLRKKPRRAGKASTFANEPRPGSEYFPVAYTGDPAETASGGRIIRVDLDPSSLFALGVNVPLENVQASVKADLLVGMDGVTRGIRLVE